MFSINTSNFTRYTLVAGFALLMVSCKKDEEAEPRIGAVTGSVSPRTASAVRLVDANKVEKTMTPTSNGMFTFGNVGAGDYTVKVTPHPGWRNPGVFPVAVTGNTSASVGDIEMVRNSYATYKVGTVVIQDSAETRTGGLTMMGEIVNDTSLVFSTNTVRAGGKPHAIEFYIPKFTGAGEYKFTGPGGNQGVYESDSFNPWTSTNNGSVNITSYDAVHQIISGTFTFKAQQGANPLNAKDITGGTFRNIYIGNNY